VLLIERGLLLDVDVMRMMCQEIIQSNSGTATSSGRAGNGIEREVDDDEEAETDGELESRGGKEGLKEDGHLEGVVGK
jgi:hypothetical protein